MNKKKFDKISESEKWLYNYKSTKAGIESLKEEYETLNDIDFEVDVLKRAKWKTNDEGENIATQLDLIDNRIKTMKRKIEQIDRALSSLSNIEREIIRYKCIEGMRYYEFTYKVHMSERQCMRIKKRALRKINIALGL